MKKQRKDAQATAEETVGSPREHPVCRAVACGSKKPIEK
jgi:hypothetical protein